MPRQIRTGLALLSVLLWTTRVWAAGGGMNVVVVVNQASTNSVELGNYFMEKRQVPPGNLLRISWPGDAFEWTTADFQLYLLNPLLNLLATRQLSNQVDYVALSMDIPYRTRQDGSSTVSGRNSTTSALFYGFKPDFKIPTSNPASCNLPNATSNNYAGSEGIFRATSVATSNSWLAIMITSSNLADAKAIIDRGPASDGGQPNNTIVLSRNPDTARNVRYESFDNAIFDFRVRGRTNLIQNTAPTPLGYSNLLGWSFGDGYYSIATNTFVPGAMADSLTSYGGDIFAPNNPQTTLFAMLGAGATASYGTVTEPCVYREKFPSPMTYFYQLRGFNIAESYYQSVTNPYQGLLVGEPLASPYARPASGGWVGLASNASLTGTTNLSVAFTAATPRHPVQQIDLFVDGRQAQTLTNAAPRQNNVLNVTINGHAMSYTVPANATIKSVAAGLATEIGRSTHTNVTKVRPVLRGDRIELQSMDSAQPGAMVSLTAGASQGSAAALTTFLHAEGSSFVDSEARGYLSMLVSNAPPASAYVALAFTKTNGTVITVSATNTGGMTATALVQALMSKVNTEPLLEGPDGVTADDLFSGDSQYGWPFAEFNVRARSAGWAAAKLQVQLTGSSGLVLGPSGIRDLVSIPTDMFPRQHLYVTAGLTNLAMTFGFNTTTQANGYHDLMAVAYEGSHVRTQKRASAPVRIQNAGLSATLAVLYGGTNTALGTTLQFQVTATGGTVSRTELFSTGGSLGVVSNSASASFAVPTANLGIGRHPFYAVVTPVSGTAFRTETTWLRIIGPEPPFSLTALAEPARLTWPATVGRNYQMWSGPTPITITNLRASLIATNSPLVWLEPETNAPGRFYRVIAP